MNKIKLEACCGSVGDVIIADKLNFDSIELNSSLENGGMTPSVGTLIMAKSITKLPIYTMVRARPRGFNYIEAEYQAMLIDAKNLIANGADGIVFGFLNADGTINETRTKKMVEVIGEKDAIFHKAFDSTLNLEASIQTLIKLKVDRILTSGGVGNILENLEIISQLQAKYKDQIELIVGGGITSENICEVIATSKVNYVHFTGKTLIYDESTSHVKHPKGRDEYSYVGVSEENMRKIIEEVEKIE